MKYVGLIVPALLAASPALAQSGAAPYRALGTEPFWSLSIDRDAITYQPADGRPVRVVKPRPSVGVNGEQYRARGMTVAITHVRCSDGMSDRTYRDTVRVTIGRRTLRGCGGDIVATDSVIANTRWIIAAIDGRPLRLERPATLEFTADRIQGHICNSFGGDYRFYRGALTAGTIIGTQMGCVGPTMEAENAVYRALRQKLHVHRGDGDTLVLSNAGASITLRRAR